MATDSVQTTFTPSYSAMTTQGKIEGIQTTLLLDSGSGLSFVDARFIDSRGLAAREDRYSGSVRTVTANGEELQVRGVINLRVMLGTKESSHTLLVSPNFIYTVLLGNDFLYAHDASAFWRQQRIVLDGESLPVDFAIVPDDDDFSVRLADDVVIPPHESHFDGIGLITPTLATKHVTAMVEGVPQLARHELTLARVLVTTNTSIPLRFLNSTRAPVTLHKGMKVGSLCLLDATQPVMTLDVHPAQTSKSVTTQDWNQLDFLKSLHVADVAPEREKQRVKDLLWKYKDRFAADPKKPGQTDVFHHKIDTGDHLPINLPAYRVAPTEADIIKKEIKSMLESGVVSESHSPWAAPVVLAPKKDGKIRFCVDYRKLNAVTKRDVYPITRIDDTLDALTGMRIFSALDLASGYWQIPIDEADREKTAFSTRFGLYEFNYMPFGLTNAPATFQRAMDMVLSGLKWHICLVYLDDIIIFARDYDSHLHNLTCILQALATNKLTLRLDKCHFLMDQVNYLGHIISSNGIRPDPAKVRDIQDFPVPQNLRDVRAFVGLCGYYSNHVPNFTDIAAPLYLLTRKNVRFRWTDECQQAFESLKKQLMQQPLLSFPDFSKPFIITTDASDVGLGATLSQMDDNLEMVVAYASHTLNSLERAYSATEKECLAVKWAIGKFRPYIYGSKFTVHTDHWALQWLRKFKNPTGRLARWALALQDYDFDVIHRPGKQIPHVDALSRYPDGTVHPARPRMLPTHAVNVVTDEWGTDLLQVFRDAQKRDRALDELRLRAKVVSPKSNLEPERFFLEDDLLYRLWKPRTNKVRQASYRQLVIPASLRHEVMFSCHEDVFAGHLGIEKTLARMHQRFYWPGMKADVQHWVGSCLSCASKKNPQTMVVGRLMNIPVPDRPWHTIGIDFLGPFQPSGRGNRYILVVTDYLSKWPEAFAVADQKEATVARILVEELFCRYGPPRRLLSDRGRQFLGSLVTSIYKMWGVTKLTTAAYHPQTDGLTERFNKTLAHILSKYVDEHHTDWDCFIPFALYAYRTSVHATTREMPYTMLFGVDPWMPLDIGLTKDTAKPLKSEDIKDYRDQVRMRLETAWKLAKDNTEAAQMQQTRHYDKNRVDVEYAIGSKVWIYLPVTKKQHTTKLTHFWCGPFDVIEKITPVTYRVKGVNKRRLDSAIHVTRMKPYLDPEAQVPASPDALDDPDLEVNDDFLGLPADVAVQDLDEPFVDTTLEPPVDAAYHDDTDDEQPGELVDFDALPDDEHPYFIAGHGVPVELLDTKRMAASKGARQKQMYLTRFRNKTPAEDAWITYSSLPKLLVRDFKAQRKQPGGAK